MTHGKSVNWISIDEAENIPNNIAEELFTLGGKTINQSLMNENMELKYQIRELQLQVGDWQDVAEQTINERTKLCNTVAFFASVIKSGEQWSDVCQTMYDNTIKHLPSRK